MSLRIGPPRVAPNEFTLKSGTGVPRALFATLLVVERFVSHVIERLCAFVLSREVVDDCADFLDPLRVWATA